MIPELGERPEEVRRQQLALGDGLLGLPGVKSGFRPEETDGGSGIDHVFIPLVKGHQDMNQGGGFHHLALVNLESEGGAVLRTGGVDRAFRRLQCGDHAKRIPSAIGPVAFAVNFGYKGRRHSRKGVGNANIGGAGVEKERVDRVQRVEQIHHSFRAQAKVLLNIGQLWRTCGRGKVLIDKGADRPQEWVFWLYSHSSTII